MLSDSLEWRFDWYRCGVYETPATIIEQLLVHYNKTNGLGFYTSEPTRPIYGYAYAELITNGTNRICLIQWGGTNSGEAVFVEFAGSLADAGAEFMRSRWKDNHYCMRCDVKADFITAGYETIVNYVFHPIAKRKRLKVIYDGDWFHKVDGRTLNVGSRSSGFMCRFYEKGIQIGGNPNLIRLEAEIKNGTLEDKLVRAKLSPKQLAQSNKWFVEALELLGQTVAFTPCAEDIPHITDRYKALDHMIKQYANTMCHFADKDPEFFTWLAQQAFKNRSA